MRQLIAPLLAALAIAAAPCASIRSAAAAEPAGCVLETEPNDTPEVLSGPAATGASCLEGTMPSGDQDLAVWEIGPGDTATRWTITLDGVPGVRTVMEFRPIVSEPGIVPLVPGSPVLELAAESDVAGPTLWSDALVAPGRYLVGVSAGGQPEAPPDTLGYRLTFAPGAPLPASADPEPNDDPATAGPVADAFEIAGDLAGSWDLQRWAVSADAAAQAASWTLEARLPLGVYGDLTLADASGAPLVRTSARQGRAELPDLVLAPGDYLVRLEPPASLVTPYVLTARPADTLDGDPEPNDDAAHATAMTGPGATARGRLSRAQDEDWFRFTVTDEMAAETLDVRMIWRSDARRELCLEPLGGGAGRSRVCRESREGITLAGLSLAAGEHVLRVTGDEDPADAYVLRVDPAGPGAPDVEREPNDTPGMASPVDPRTGVRGRGGAADVDVFRVAVGGEPQLWEVTAEGAAILALDWVATDGTLLGRGDSAPDGSGARLTDLYLIPGEHWLRVRADGAYALQLSPLGPPDPDAEREPNEVAGREERLVVGRSRTGRLPLAADTDVYQFEVRGTDHVVAHLDVDEGMLVKADLTDDVSLGASFEVGPGAPLDYDALLPPGRYRLTLSPMAVSEGRYRLRLDRADAFLLADDQEPNDDPRSARSWPADGIVRGGAVSAFDVDWYDLPADIDGADLVVSADGAITMLRVTDGITEVTLGDIGGSRYAGSLPGAQGPLRLVVGTSGAYRLRLGEGPLDDPVRDRSLPLRATLQLDGEVAAHWPTGQRVPAVLRVVNDGPEDLALTTRWVATDPTWLIDVGAGAVTVAPGAAVEVPLEVRVPPMVPADAPVRISVRLAADDGRAGSAFVEASPSREAIPVTPEVRWSIPAELLGGLDAASLALGAVPIVTLDTAGEASLHDGFATMDTGLSWVTGGAPVVLTVDLAGAQPIPVRGTVLHLLAADPTLGEGVRTFDLALSLDGAAWEVVLTGSVERIAREQAFVLPRAVPARFAQLRVTAQQRTLPSRFELGEWKVVAEPGWAPPGDPLDLADPLAGGHVVTMTPLAGSRADTNRLLDADLAPQVLPVEPRSAMSLVLGFMEDRAARIAELEWHDPVPSDPASRLDRLTVSVSVDGPLGPWREDGVWTLDRAPDGLVPPYVLADAPFVSFIRLDGTVRKRQRSLELPGRLSVREADQGGAYRSILGQWGMGQRTGPLEWQAGVQPIPADDEPDPPVGSEAPSPLALGQPASGRVERGVDTDWYRVTVPDGQRGLTITLRGIPRVGTALRIHGADGIVLPATFAPGDSPGSVAWAVAVEPGRSYLVEVLQPPASLAATFDTSASVVTELPAIRAGLLGLAADIRAGEEGLRVLPFDGEPLLPGWPDDPYVVADAVNRYQLGPSSSGAEANLEAASQDLAGREGGRAVLLVTDAASSSFERTRELWAELAATRPLVVAVEVGGVDEAPAVERHHLMVDWAASADGIYRHASSGTDIEEAFDALATWLRRPALYELTAFTRTDPPPGPDPGSISVITPEVDGVRRAAVRGDVAVALVLDTSGSMLELFAGERRIDIARRTLRELVTQDLPAGLPLSLRVFEPRPKSCDTILAVPLAPLDPAATAAVIDGIEASATTKTPLAAAIAAVADDLASAQGPRVVVVVSDGRESCKGRPEEAVKALRAEGFDVTVNVIGLALDRASRRSSERLAKLGGGTFFDAADPDTLRRALRAAVSVPFVVLDASGAEEARGTIGGKPLAVPAGSYRVQVMGDPEWTFDDVFVGPGSDIVLELPRVD